MRQKIFQYKFSIITSSIIIFLSMAESPNLPSTPFLNIPYLDKLVHFAMYTGLSMVLFLEKNWNNVSPNQKIGQVYNMLLLLMAVLMGGLLEILQPLLSDRARDFGDFVANTTGVVLGFYLHKGILPLLKGQKIF
ncbi:VanZ family protein [Geofilum rhodophaeum]|uniref:VanZ family protein n=1 Tax=Geofilum rhodophaeum TaxID=1965019 RepID=UPI000B5265D7|nr:VanZ family protein [Geofilum rhodophaeum]